MTLLLTRYNNARTYLRSEAAITQKIALSILFAVMLAVASQIKIYTPFTPVPINLGTLAVCASALTLGGFWGFVSVAIYLAMAAIGMPVIAGTSVLGATTGYLVGYAVMALVVGKITEQKSTSLKNSAMLFIAQIAIVHTLGMIGLYIWSLYSGNPYTLVEVLMKGSLVFLVGDAIKAVLVSGVLASIIKK